MPFLSRLLRRGTFVLTVFFALLVVGPSAYYATKFGLEQFGRVICHLFFNI